MTDMKKSRLIVAFIAGMMFSLLFAFLSFASDGFEVHFIDVGQADAALVKCDGHYMLIDGGSASDSSLIFSYLKKQGVDSLDYIVNTHGDEDHVGGLPGAVQLVGSNIGKVLAPYKTLDKDRVQVFIKKLAQYNKSITVPKKGEQFSLGNAKFQVLSAGGTEGNQSLVLRVKYGDTSFMFTGDADEDQEKEIISSGCEIESDVLKVGHHGSDTSTCYQFIKAVYPSAAVISVGADNSYGHPTEEVLSRLRDEGASVFRTDNNGDIIFVSDGKNIKYSTEKTWNQQANLGAAATKTTATKVVKSSATDKTGTESKSTGDSAAVAAGASVGESVSTGGDAQAYVLNTNTKKFHYPSCNSVNQMKAKNRKDVTDTRDNIISQGYVPCKNCNP